MPLFEIDSNAVHVWRVALDRSREHQEHARALLADDERSRADRFRFDRDKDRWIIARSALRRILASYLESDPTALRFCLSPFGKPSFAEQSDETRLEFNVSHAQAYALIAVSRCGPLGIDLESLRADVAWNDFGGVFAQDEQALLDAAAPDERIQTFFRLWTRKEAFLKAEGTGLSGNLSRSTLSGLTMAVHDLTPAEGYVGAVAVPDGVIDVISFEDEWF